MMAMTTPTGLPDASPAERTIAFLSDLERLETLNPDFFAAGTLAVFRFEPRHDIAREWWGDIEVGNVEAYQAGQGWGGPFIQWDGVGSHPPSP